MNSELRTISVMLLVCRTIYAMSALSCMRNFHVAYYKSHRKWHPTTMNYTDVLLVLALEGSYVSQGSFTEEKGIVN